MESLQTFSISMCSPNINMITSQRRLRHASAIFQTTADGLALRRKLVLAALQEKTPRILVMNLELLQRLSVPVVPFADLIARLAVSPARTVRDAASSLIVRAGDEVLPVLCPIAESGKPAEREQALRLIARLESAEGKLYLQERATRETHAKVRAAVEELLGQNSSEEPRRTNPCQTSMSSRAWARSRNEKRPGVLGPKCLGAGPR